MSPNKPYKTKVERDIQHSEDLRVSGLQGGKALGDHLALFSLIMGIPFLLIGLYALISMTFNLGSNCYWSIIYNGWNLIIQR
jgi:hypothetical protein